MVIFYVGKIGWLFIEGIDSNLIDIKMHVTESVITYEDYHTNSNVMDNYCS